MLTMQILPRNNIPDNSISKNIIPKKKNSIPLKQTPPFMEHILIFFLFLYVFILTESATRVAGEPCKSIT